MHSFVYGTTGTIIVIGEAFLNESQGDIGSLKSSVESLFDGNYNETWNATLNQFDAFVSNLSFYLSCFESNKFVGKQLRKSQGIFVLGLLKRHVEL